MGLFSRLFNLAGKWEQTENENCEECGYGRRDFEKCPECYKYQLCSEKDCHYCQNCKKNTLECYKCKNDGKEHCEKCGYETKCTNSRCNYCERCGTYVE